MEKQNVPATAGTPASKSVTGRTVWDFATHIATTVGPLILLVTGAVYAFFKFQEQSYQNQIALLDQNTAAMTAQHEIVRDSQSMMTEAHRLTQESYQSTSAMNANMMTTINVALTALKTAQEHSDQKVKSANDEIQVMRSELGKQLADQKERAENELKRIGAEVATANEVKEQAMAQFVKAQQDAEAARRRRITAEEALDDLQEKLKVTESAVAEAQKVRIEKKARLRDDVGQLIELVNQLAESGPLASQAPVAAVVEKAEDIRLQHLIDPTALLAAVVVNPTREAMGQLADLESVPAEQIRPAIDAGIPGFDAWYHTDENGDPYFVGVDRTDDYSLRVLPINLYEGSVLSVESYVVLAICTIPSPVNWDDSLLMFMSNELWGDRVDFVIADEPSDEPVNLLKDGILSFELLIKSFGAPGGAKLLNGQPITVKAFDLPTLWAKQPTTARKLVESSKVFARADAMRRNAESFSGRLLVPVEFFEDYEDRGTLREDTVRILNAAVFEKSDRADLSAGNLDPKAWGRLAAVVLSNGFRLERLKTGSNEVSIELHYLDEWGDPVGASVRLHRFEGEQPPTWQLAGQVTDIPRSNMAIQQGMPEQ